MFDLSRVTGLVWLLVRFSEARLGPCGLRDWSRFRRMVTGEADGTDAPDQDWAVSHDALSSQSMGNPAEDH
jgi:hypothetical protein